MNNNIQDWTKRAQRYWYVDGLAEIGVGSILLVLGIFYIVTASLPRGALKGWLLGLGQPILIIGLAVFIRWIVRWLKERVTFPRTGFVAYRGIEPRRRISGILMAIFVAVSLGMVVFLSRSWVNLRWLTSITGLFTALLTLMIAYRIRILRFFVLAIYTLAVGFTASLIGLPDPLSNSFFLGSIGLGWVVSGAITLVKYLRNSKPADGELDLESE